jgi:hypothetical protein
MKIFVFSIIAILATSALFLLGAMIDWPFLMISMCPGALVALWLNGFAARSSGIRIVVNPEIESSNTTANGTRGTQKKQRAPEYN